MIFINYNIKKVFQNNLFNRLGVIDMYDFHIHSEFSVDSKSKMEDYAIKAVEKNMKSICFTDHIDLEMTKNKIDIGFIPSDYFKELRQLKYNYKNKLEILSGVEIGFKPELKERYNKIINNNPFDFVILSVHSVGFEDIHKDGFTYDKTPLEALNIYYDYMYQCIKDYNNYDVLGHIDYIDRYFKDFSLLPDFNKYYDKVEKILKLIIDSKKGIEINTAGLRYGLDYFHPKKNIIELYKELGGEIFTIGSDAHNPKHLNFEYESVKKYLKYLGYKNIFIFRERKKFPIFID